MSLFINADYKGWFAVMAAHSGGLGFTREGKRTLLREANRTVVEIWHRKFIRKHFQSAARSRYHYQQRKPKYRGIKMRIAAGEKVFIRGKELEPEVIRKGGRVDIVRSGETESRANLQTGIVATAGQAVKNVMVPNYVTKTGVGQPNQALELVTLTRAEKAYLTTAWKAKFYRGVQVLGNTIRLKRQLGKRSGKI